MIYELACYASTFGMFSGAACKSKNKHGAGRTPVRPLREVEQSKHSNSNSNSNSKSNNNRKQTHLKTSRAT